MYEILTRHISSFSAGPYGEWFIDTVNDGSPEHPKQVPYVMYSEKVNSFRKDFGKFFQAHPEIDLVHYQDLLVKCGLEWKSEVMKAADVSRLDGQCVLALLMGIVRAERFYEGVILEFAEKGVIARWLIRLKELDEG